MLILAGAAASLFGQLLKSGAEGVAPVLLAKGRAQLADQVFERKIAEYKMNLEMQKLHREDIRDLVELSVGRMDIYHLVGALLLGTCITLYTKNPTLDDSESEHGSPTWAVSLFLASNLGAVGYLVLATWFSMHASVASHTIGVRLLTRFARLSIPGRREIEEIRVPLMPLLQGPQDAPPESATLNEGGAAVGDKDFHLRRFLREQKQWLSYDAHARICMSLGMNQVLLALSYYIVSRSSGRQPVSTLGSLVGLQVLAIILERLDVRPTRAIKVEVAALVLLGQFSPVLVGVLDSILRAHGGDAGLEATMALAFVLHGAWLMFNGLQFRLFSQDDLSVIPRRLRTVLYLDVLHMEPEDPGAPADDASPDGDSPGAEPASPAPQPRASSSSPRRHMPLLPRAATPPEELPRVLARRFTCIVALLWFAAGTLHVVSMLIFGPESSRRTPELRTRPVSGPSELARVGLFQVDGMRCAGSRLVLGDGLSHFAVQRLPSGALGQAEPPESPQHDAGAETALAAVSSVAASAPAGWSLVSAALVEGALSRREAFLAGWDGTRVVVASARNGSDGTWSVAPRFAVHGRCRGQKSQGALALQLGPGGRTLAVLHSGGTLLDLWDLSHGTCSGRWRLDAASPAASMCHDGRELLLTRRGADGVRIEAARLATAPTA